MRHSNLQESQKIVDYAMTHNYNYFKTSTFYMNRHHTILVISI